jgi:hypothetical protein
VRFARWLAWALVFCAAPAAAASPRLLLRANFDREPSCLSGQAGTPPGIGGRGSALLLGTGAECAFPGAGHLNARAGTLSFWAQPHDWNDGEGRYQVLFDWSGQANGRPFRMYVDSPAEPKVVRLGLAFGNSQDPRQRQFQIYAHANWEIGRWQKVDVTWDEHEIVLYANGRKGERLALETVRLPAPAGSRLRLTPGPGPGIARDATAIDDLEIWDAALPADRIGKRFRAASASPLAPARLRAPHTAAAPTVDGRLDDAVWKSAVRVPLLEDAETGFASLTLAHAALVWSPAALHLALEAPLTGEADAFEITLAPASGGALRSFRVTTHGLAAEDAVSGIEATSSSDADTFRAELSVPFAALGAVPSAGALLRLDLRHRPAAPGTLGVGARLADAALTLGDETEGVRISVGPELALGRLALEVERSAGADALVELVRTGARAWRERIDVRGHRELTETLDPPDGLLRLSAHDAERRELVQLESRLAAFETPGMLVVPEPEQRRLAVELDLGWLDGGWLRAFANGRAHARLVDHGPQGGESHDLVLDSGRTRVSLAEGLAIGPHRLTLELGSPSRALRFEKRVEVPKLPWLGATLGETDFVPDPWVPLGWDEDTSVRVSGRSYAFDGPLLAGVQGAGGPLLRGPMRLRLTSAAGAALFRTTAAEVTGRSAARADFAGSGVFDGAGVDVSWSAWIEYDGAVLSSFTLKPRASGTRVEELVLEVPLEPRIARYLRGTQQRSTIRRGRVPWNGDRFESAFEPFVWLSNEKEGFLYFAESAANWIGAERGGAITVRGGPSAVLLLRLIGAPVVLPGPVTYTLGFQATPVKPELAKARAWNFGGSGTPTAHQTSISWYEGYAVADGVWELERPLAVIGRDRELARRGVRPFYYATTSASPDHLPAFRLFEPLWRSAWSYSYSHSGTAGADNGMHGPVPEHHLAAVCPADGSFQQKMLYDADQLLRTGAIGLYTDTDEIFADDNPRHGCGYHDAFGQRGVSWTILAKRRFAKRLAALLREAGGGRRFWLAHAHTRLVPPVHGFIDFWYPGEELTDASSRNPWFYMDGLDDDAWRVEYGSASSGIVHVFLPEVSRGSRDPKQLEARQPTESMLAMAAVNDVNVSSAYANVDAIGEYWGLRKKLDLIDAEFVGFWRPDCPVRALSPDARASLYRTNQGPVLVVASRATVAKRVDLQLDLATLGLAAGAHASDARSGAKLVLDGDRLSVPLAARSYTYVPLR